MKLLGREITADKVMARIESRLRERGLLEERHEPIQISGVEPRVDPLSFNLRALEENVDPTIGLPLQTHREGIAGNSVIFVKQSFRRFGKIIINELLARQRVFNGHVLDSYAQLSAEVLRLREEVAKLKAATPAVTLSEVEGPSAERSRGVRHQASHHAKPHAKHDAKQETKHAKPTTHPRPHPRKPKK